MTEINHQATPVGGYDGQGYARDDQGVAYGNASTCETCGQPVSRPWGPTSKWLHDSERRPRQQWIAVFTVPGWTGSTGAEHPARRRFVQAPGHAVYRGMYRNRRRVRTVPTQLTDDQDQAYRFPSRAAAQASLSKTWGPREMERITYERVTA